MQPSDLVEKHERKPPKPTLSPATRRSLAIVGAIMALAVTGIGQTVALVKGCRAEELALANKQATAAVVVKVESLKKSSSVAEQESENTDDPQTRTINNLIQRFNILERLVLTESSSKGVTNYKAKKKPELKPIENEPEKEMNK